MDIVQLRLRHKITLIEHAFRVYKPEQKCESARRECVKFLIDGGDWGLLVSGLKGKSPMPFDLVSDAYLEENVAIGEIKIVDENLEFYSGQSRKLEVSIKNYSDQMFYTSSSNSLYISYHWYHKDGTVYLFDGVRTSLEKPVVPNGNEILPIQVVSPNNAGEYQLLVTLIIEGQAWLEDKGLVTNKLFIKVNNAMPQLSPRAKQIYFQLKDAIEQQKDSK